jgi:hypothetical protein
MPLRTPLAKKRGPGALALAFAALLVMYFGISGAPVATKSNRLSGGVECRS